MKCYVIHAFCFNSNRDHSEIELYAMSDEQVYIHLTENTRARTDAIQNRVDSRAPNKREYLMIIFLLSH